MSGSYLSSLAHKLAVPLIHYPYKIWGYGEEIGLAALLAAARGTRESRYSEFVHGLLKAWVAARPRISNADHVAPGLVLLEVYSKVRDARLLSQACKLAEWFTQVPRGPFGAGLHRADQSLFSSFIYVDCMAVDAPFLGKFAEVTGDGYYYRLGAELIFSHVQALQDQNSGLFSHVYNASQNASNGVFWGRGNGWALLGLVSTLEQLPQDEPARPFLHRSLEKLAAGLLSLQDGSGHWHTVLNDPQSYTETSLAAIFAYGLRRAVRSNLIPTAYEKPASAAFEAFIKEIDSDGSILGVSQATPPGDHAHYCRVPRGGIYPWGHGPALLAVLQQMET